MEKKRCVPCEGGIPKLPAAEVQKNLKRVSDWVLLGDRIERSFKFKDFVQTMKFTNQVADLAEREGHHPDFEIHYSQLKLSLWTHAVGGLTENDFIMAEEINALPR